MPLYGPFRPGFVTQRDGSALANSNCRMASIAMGLSFDADPQGSKTSSGKKMRTYTDDQSGGTDSSDAKQAWDRGYSEGLRVMDGHTFDDALADLRAGRVVHLDVWHAKTGPCVSGSGTYGHTMAVLPDLSGEGWAVGDPWCTDGYHRVSESKLRSGAEYWAGQVYSRAALEPDYPTGGPGPTDPRVLVIVRRIVKRLMDQYDPGNPAPGDIGPDTGGGAILYTTTRAVPAEEDQAMAYQVTIDGRVGRIDIIPNAANKYLELDTGKLHGDYTFTSKDPAMPGTIKPDVGGRADGYLVGAELAWIPGHNATFTEREDSAAAQWDADAAALLGPRPG